MSTQKKSTRRKSIQHSDPGKILDLVMSLAEGPCKEMQVKINNYLREECEADLCLCIVMHGDKFESYVETVGNVILQRKVKLRAHSDCQFSENLEPYRRSRRESSFFVPADLVKEDHAQQFQLTPKNSEVLKHENSILLTQHSTEFQSLVAPFLPKDNIKRRTYVVPIQDKPFSVKVIIIAPKIEDELVYVSVKECFLFVWPTLNMTIQYEYEATLKRKCQQLLRVARRLFTQVASLETLLQIAMEQAKQLTKAEYCAVMLVDPDRMELVEAYYAGRKEESTARRFPFSRGIAGHVIKSGFIVNTASPKEHPGYDPEVDGFPGVECKTMLCFPIRDQTGIIGVGQLINKIGDPYFDLMDEEMALAFSIYCGVCIMHSVIYEKIQEAHIRNALANELVMYHMKVADSEVVRVTECTGFHNHPHICSLHFNPRVLPLRELPCYAVKFFTDLGFDQKFNIKYYKLAKFVLQVKKGYRDVPYHNWLHGFNVAQWAYAAITNFKLVKNGYLNDLQALMYVVAGLTHDLDHRGTTNSFHMNGQTTLAALYSSEGSVMERHHLAQAICILNTQGCDILESLPRKDYDRALIMLKDYVLASDLATYFKNLNEYKTISMDFLKGNRVHVSALQCLLMNGADMCDQLKDWGSIKKTSAAVITEFYKQGDVEKSRGELPVMMMDREKCFIPDLELQFLQTTCKPLFEMLGRILPRANHCVTIIENHMERWQAAKPIFAEVPPTAGLSVLLSPELDHLIEQKMLEAEKLRQEAEVVAAAPQDAT